jgi:hypothetical protein
VFLQEYPRAAGFASAPFSISWSLGIEEQFYIGWPLLLAALFRRTRKVLLAVGLVALLSFCFNVATVSGDPVSVFYSPAARIWELLIGAGLTCYLAKGGRRLKGFANEGAAVLGCVLIAASTILMNSRTPFPGWWALPPTLGAATLILTADAWINRRVLASRGFVFLGLISYPVYLWHWPLLTFFRLVNESDLHLSPVRVRLIRIALLVLPCFLAWGTWRFWETPVRRAKTVGRLPTIPALTIAMTAVFMAAMLGALGWIPPRLNSPEVKRIFQATLDRGGMPYNNFLKSDFRATEFRSGNPEVTLFAGDSHAEQYAPRVRTAIEHNAGLASAAFLIHGGCPPLPGLNPQMPGFDCPKFYRFWTSAAARARTVVIAAYWEMYFTPPGTTGPTGARLELVTASGTPVREADIDGAWRGLEHAIRGWIGDGKRVVLLLSSPASKSFNPMRALRRFGRTDLALLQPMRYDEFERFLSPVEEPLKVLAASTGAELIRTADYFCESGMCPPVDAQGEPIYVDDNHLRARTVVQKAVFIDDLLRR